MARGRVSDLQRHVMGHRMVEERPEGPQARLGARSVSEEIARPDGCAEYGYSELRTIMLAHGIDYRGCQRLMELGVEGRFVAELSASIAIGVARVCLSRDGSRWEPEGPTGRLLLACFDDGHLVDIAAVSTSHPDQVALRTGDGWCLGEDRIEDAHRAQLAGRRAIIRIVRDPLAWLRARGQALCVFDHPDCWAVAVRELRLLGERVTLECDAGSGEQLRARLKVGGLPRVSERAPEFVRMEAA